MEKAKRSSETSTLSDESAKKGEKSSKRVVEAPFNSQIQIEDFSPDVIVESQDEMRNREIIIIFIRNITAKLRKKMDDDSNKKGMIYYFSTILILWQKTSYGPKIYHICLN
jgi:hypothetical protein